MSAPARREPLSAALLRDGGQVILRPYHASDRAAVAHFLEALSPESRALRFHGAVPRITDDLLNRVVAGHAIVAECRDRLVSIASWQPLRDPERAEIAFTVEDAHQGRGIGTALFERLAADARQEGVKRFTALVLAANQAMIDLLAHLGFTMSRHLEYGELEYDVDLVAGPEAAARADERLHQAARLSLRPLFEPRSVAVVGASRRRGTVGHELFRNVLAGGFDGPVYPVNPNARSVGGVRAYATVRDIPDQLDLAVIVVPAAQVLTAASECLEVGAQALVVVSAGFAEIGPEGRMLQDELLRLCRSHEARLVGPNCLGVLVRRPEGWLNATFAPVLPPAGGVAVASQSGALGIAILSQASSLGIGISAFVSMGNKADLSSNDLLEHWEDDPATQAIVLYLESFGNPRRFGRVARRVGARKPIIAVKGGRGQSGKRAAASHTAAMAGSNEAVDALFHQAGVTRCDTLGEAFDVAKLLANQPLPAGSRVGIITNAGGLGILGADACESRGLTLPGLSSGTITRLAPLLSSETHPANPLDLVATCTPETYGLALRAMLDDPAIDAVIAMFVRTATNDGVDVEQRIADVARLATGKPLLACFPDESLGAAAQAAGVPVYRFPEAAGQALSQSARRAAWLRRPTGALPSFTGIQRQVAEGVVNRALARDTAPWLTPREVGDLLRAYGIALPESEVVHNARQARQAAERLNGPLAMKVISPEVLHKSEIGGVRLNVASPAVAAEVFADLESAMKAHGFGDQLEGVLVQRMAPPGIECFVGVVNDPLFGPLVAFGLGGTATEVLGDVAFRLNPLTDVDAADLLRSVKMFKLLSGFRGRPPADLAAVEDVLLRVSRLVDDFPAIAEMDLNPLIVRSAGEGALAVDARIRLHSERT